MDFHTIIKIVTGIFVVPFAIISNHIWPWWIQTSLVKKILSAPFVLPIVGITFAVSFWWNDF